MNKCKRYSKSYLPSALYPWSFPLMIIVIIISQSCAFFQPFKLKEFYTVNESLVPQKKFQQGEKVQVVISGDSSGTQTKTRLIGYDKAYGRTTSTYLTEEKETELYFDIIIKNHATGEEYEPISREVYTDDPGFYSATITGYRDTFGDEHELHRTIQFEVTPKASANLSKIEASKQTFDPENILTFFDNNIRNDKIKSWLKNLSAILGKHQKYPTRAKRGWGEIRFLDLFAHLDFSLFHNAEGDIYRIRMSISHHPDMGPYWPYGLSSSQTRREVESILGKSKEPKGYEQDSNSIFPMGFYPSKRINIVYHRGYSDTNPHEIQFYKEGFYLYGKE